MDLYLMQHGEAAAEEEDPARPLTAAGRESGRRVAAHAGATGVRVDRVVHSGKLRAEQTATLLADALGGPPVSARDGLSPTDRVSLVADWLATLDAAAVAVVGHLPFLDRLASLLVTGDEQAQVLAFRNGGLVRLVPKADRPGYAVGWVITPEVAVVERR